MGGLRTLLASPLRDSLLAPLPEARRTKLDQQLHASWQLATTAGILRVLCLFGAVASLFQPIQQLSTVWLEMLCWVAAALVAGVHLEGIPSLVSRGRFLGLVLAALPLVRVLAWPLRPVTCLIEVFLARIGTNPESQASKALVEELVEVAKDQDHAGELSEVERRMIGRIMALPETDAAEVMTPRTEITAIQAQASLQEALDLASKEGHSRILVYEEDLDHVIGVFYVKDALSALQQQLDLQTEVVREHMRKPLIVPETSGGLSLLNELRRRRVHLAVVVDEYGGTAGVVSIEDIVEEIVGEIEDEHDLLDEALQVERRGPDEALVDGRLPITALNESFGTTLPEDEFYDTLAGLLCDRFGYIPQQGETMKENGVVMQVVEADERRIQRIRVLRNGAGIAQDLKNNPGVSGNTGVTDAA